MISRRSFHKVALAGLSASSLAVAKPDSKIAGIQIGAQSYSFRDRPLDAMIAAFVEVGLSECELWQGHLEPKGVNREAMRTWRTSTPLDFFKDVKKKFDDAGIQIYAYNYSFRDDFSDEEIARGFDMAKAMGAKVITASATVPVAKRVDAFASKAKMMVGMHNHSVDKPGEFATPKSFLDAMAGNSKYIAINLDIGHFAGANFDPVPFLKEHHDKIVTLHIKDMKKDKGPAVPFGEGDARVKDVMQMLKENRWKFPANIEYEYKGADSVAEVKRCYEFCKAALA